METIIMNVMNKFGYLGIMLLIALENLFPPIPSEVILPFGGFVTQRPNSGITIFGVILFATIGSLLGAIILYYIGKILNKERLIKIVSGKIGKILQIKPKDIEMADDWFDKKGNKTVFFCRFIPIVRSLISIPAGMSEMKMSKFLLYTLLGSAIWNSVLIILGSILGDNWESISKIINKFSYIVLIMLIIGFIILIIIFYKRKRNNKINS